MLMEVFQIENKEFICYIHKFVNQSFEKSLIKKTFVQRSRSFFFLFSSNGLKTRVCNEFSSVFHMDSTCRFLKVYEAFVLIGNMSFDFLE